MSSGETSTDAYGLLGEGWNKVESLLLETLVGRFSSELSLHAIKKRSRQNGSDDGFMLKNRLFQCNR